MNQTQLLRPIPRAKTNSTIPTEELLFCSFWSGDSYYRDHSERLEKNLTELNVAHHIVEIQALPGEDWADVCRKKIGFMAQMALENPEKKVFWIDVDCALIKIPEFISESTADFIGFQRGFSAPVNIGYEKKGRFWEPCFWGINTTMQARKFIEDAYAFEQIFPAKATDDYFLEESWKMNSAEMSFQMIPSNTAAFRGARTNSSKDIFFEFGSSGNVAEFKNKVQQHKAQGRKKRSLSAVALSSAKLIEDKLPKNLSKVLRKISDGSGITGLLTGFKHETEGTKNLQSLMKAAKSGKVDEFKSMKNTILSAGMLSPRRKDFIKVSQNFLDYSSGDQKSSIPLAWWNDPKPGNYGDWLSPLVFHHYSEDRVIHVPLAKSSKKPHIVGVGSIARFIKNNSVVVGTGASSMKYPMNKSAHYISLRGPLTAQLLKESRGVNVDSFGDPALVLPKIFPLKRGATNGRILLVRHFSHQILPLQKPENMDEISVFQAGNQDISQFLEKLITYDFVVTSAMHVQIACQSYGIPSALVTFKGLEDSVPGDGMKYRDYSLGAEVPVVMPVPIGVDLRKIDFEHLLTNEKISQQKIDQVEDSIINSINFIRPYLK